MRSDILAIADMTVTADFASLMLSFFVTSLTGPIASTPPILLTVSTCPTPRHAETKYSS